MSQDGLLKPQPVKMASKDSTIIPHKKQYPLKPEAKAGLHDKFLKHGNLKSCQSPYNTPILPVNKSNGTIKWYKI